jgi:glutamate decarboxylase
LGVGWINWRESDDLPEELVFRVNYLGGEMPTFALNFSRPGGQVVAQYYNFLRLGREGYRKIQQACADTALQFAEKIAKIEPFEVIYNGQGGIPGVCWKLREDGKPKPFSLYDLSDRLRYHGWQVPAYSLPSNCQQTVVQRILVRHGISKDLVSALVENIKEAIEYFDKHPISMPLTNSEASGYRH